MRYYAALVPLQICLLTVAVLPQPAEHALAAPVPPPKPLPADLAELARQARSKDEATRERAVGILLGKLKPGMSRAQVEALLGPPHQPVDVEVAELGETEDVTYYARLPKKPGSHLMTVQYDTRKRPWRFLKVRGPHVPVD